MARYRGPKCRLCRREQEKLFLKGKRCLTDKCSFQRRPYPPGAGAQKPQKLSDYALQLREKQRIRRIYGVGERQFRNYFEEAKKMRGKAQEYILCLLERRLDNVVYRLGWAPSRAYARQLVSHRHIVVNGKRVNIPSYLVNKDDIILLRKKEGMQIQDVNPPAWLSLNKEEQKACVLSLPQREHIDVSCNEELIATFYSR